MIRIYIILFYCLTISISLLSQDHYWYGHKRIPLIPSNQKYVIINQRNNNFNLDTIKVPSIGMSSEYQIAYSGIISDNELNELDKSTLIYSSPTYKRSEDAENMLASQYIYVKLKTSSDYELLVEYASKNKAIIVDQSDYATLWYVLSCANCDRNAIEIANVFYESKMFEYAEPDFWRGNDLFSIDPLFEQQWNLRNTGQYGATFTGIDINHDSTMLVIDEQSNIVIAVFDTGVQCNHPDLSANIFGTNYDVDSSQHITKTPTHPHGTACAGIIGAIPNNGIGIKGIFNGKLMSISHDFKEGTRLNRADGFYYAAKNGADVISNSWKCPENLTAIDEAIDHALEKGRNGLGCVVVFATGNDDINKIAYPANSDERIIAVGAASPCGERKSKKSCDGESKWGSQYGPELDVVAPGVFIPTTDLVGKKGTNKSGDYISNFNGTSAACPHVAAVAGLILSVNPNLTAKQVADIIENTAQRVGEYDYLPKEGRPNGKWHEQMGYGLVDAYAAVLAAQPKYIQNLTYQSGQEVYEYATELTAGYAVTNAKPYGNVVLEAGSDVTLRGMDKVVLKPGFHAKAGSKLHIKVDAPTTTQATAAPQRIAPKTSSSNDANSTNEDATYNGVENIANNVIASTSIYTISGQLIQTITGGQHDGTHLPNGMYILQHRMSDGSMKSEKIINSK